MNPLLFLLPNVYAALVAVPLVLEGEEVPVFQPQLPSKANPGRYVLLTQPTANRSGGSRGCKVWTVTVLADVVTLFTPGYVESIPADTIASWVCQQLDGVLLPVEGYQASAATVEAILSGNDSYDGELVDIHRYVRVRWTLTEQIITPPQEPVLEAIYYENYAPVQAEAGAILTYETYEQSTL